MRQLFDAALQGLVGGTEFCREFTEGAKGKLQRIGVGELEAALGPKLLDVAVCPD